MFLGGKKIRPAVKIPQSKTSKMIQADKNYLKKLEKTILPSDENDKINTEIVSTIKNIKNYISERELFWMYYE